MFLKLLKNDFKYYSRNFITVIIASIAAGLLFAVSKVTFQIPDFSRDKAEEISMLIFMSVLFIAAVYAIIITINIFKNKFISDESYLTFSLPTRKYQHLISNIILTLFWEAAIIATEFAIMLCFKPFREGFVFPFFEQFINLFKASPGASVLTIIHYGFISANMVSLVYLCCTISNITFLKKWPKVIGIILFSSFMILEFHTMDFLPKGNYRILTDHGNLYFASHILFHLSYSLVWFFLNVYLLEKKIEVD